MLIYGLSDEAARFVCEVWGEYELDGGVDKMGWLWAYLFQNI